MTESPIADPIQTAGPFLKWAGGKGRLLTQYAPLFPAPIPGKRYFEPFAGSGAVFFHLRGGNFADSYHLSDINPELINVYRAVRDDVEALIALLAEHKSQHEADAHAHFYAVRALDRVPGWPGNIPLLARAARMIYLNRTCYNGLWRVNSRGEFNVPLGRYKNPAIVNAARLRAASVALQEVTVDVRGFADVVEEAKAGDFVYFDPPYVPLNATANFTSYAREGFGMAEQEALADAFRTLAVKGCRVMLSNADAPAVHELYAGFHIHTVQARRAINSSAGKRGPVSEVVVTSYAL